MSERMRIAIVGAATLAGKELAEALSEGPFAAAELLLMDEDEGLGQLEATGDEMTVVGAIDPELLAGVDYLFFTGTAAQTRAHWKAAAQAHVSIVDMTGTLAGEPGVLLAAPWVKDALGGAAMASPDLHTPALVAAHIGAVAPAVILARVMQVAPVRSAWATLLEPASQHGRAAVDELHQQTVALLNFQSLPKDIYDAQIAFNLTPGLGEEAKIDLNSVQETVMQHYALLSGGRLPEVALQLVQAPAFHGYTLSLGVELERPIALEQLEAALSGDPLDVTLGDNDPPNNLSCAGQDDILLRLRRAQPGEGPATRFWIWAAFDNLKLASLHAVACAGELRKLRPTGKIQ